MGTKPWPHFILFLLIVNQIACSTNWKLATHSKRMVISDAVVKNAANFNNVDFSKVDEVELDNPTIETLTIALQSPMRNVKELSIANGNVPKVQVASQFERFYVDRCNTQTVEIAPGGNYKTKDLALTNGKLKSLPKNLPKMSKLLELNLHGNLIETVDMAELNGLKTLREIKLSNNKITRVSFSQAVLPGMQYLTLTYNRLKDIRFDNLKAPLFEVINLVGNQMETADMSRFTGYNLRVITLDNNKIKKIIPNSVALPKLEVFSITSNQLSNVDFQNWNAPSMEVIEVEENQLKKILGLTTAFPNLRQVNLFPNPFDCTWLKATVKTLEARDVNVPKQSESNCK